VIGVPDVTLDFVSISTQRQFFQGNGNQGIIGLGPTELLEPGTTSYFDAVTKAGTPAVMAFELCPSNGTMWLGGFDANKATSAPQYTPMIPISGQGNPFYAVDLADMALGGTSLGFGSSTFQDPIVDTGTTLFYVPTAVETALLAKVNASAGWQALFPGKTLTQSGTGCVTTAGVTAAQVDAMLPAFSLSFPGMGGGMVTASVAASQSYLYDAGQGMFCLAIFDGGNESIMGDTILRAFVTVIDVAHSQIGFAPDKGCLTPSADVARPMPREHGHPLHRRP
jgi:hypothetical protein